MADNAETEFEMEEVADGDETEEEQDSSAKPTTATTTTGCGYPESRNKGGITSKDRLPLRAKSKIDKMREAIPIPPDAVPKTHLPNWPDLPLLQRLPSVPAPPGAIVFTRGLISSSLLRKKKSFTTYDPYHFARVPANQYNALHDMNTFNYMQKPDVRKLLLKQGLISCDNEVLCTQKEFNRFRAYLATMHIDQLREAIADADHHWMAERHQLLQLYKYQSMEEGKDHARLMKVENAARKNDEKQALLNQKFEEKKAEEVARDCKHKQEKERQCLNRKLLGQERDRLVARRRARKAEMDLQRRKRLIAQITMKDAAVKERVENEKAFLKRAYRQFLLEWLDAKYHHQKDNKPKREETERAIESDLKKRAHIRQEKTERYREMLPELIANRKAKEARVWNIVKRLFYKWLRKTRDRKARKPDALHQSLWDASHVMEDTLKYLRKESGYEKFDEFILNILKLKEQIKLRLAEEEAQEAAALAASEETKTQDETTDVPTTSVATLTDASGATGGQESGALDSTSEEEDDA